MNVPAGGAAYLADYIREREAQNPHTLVVSAGDLIGASPLLSALFHDEPTIEAMNLIGLDINAVGNHEFDEGADELQRMQNGGCHPIEGCKDGDGFAGADFPFLAANVIDTTTGKPIFRALRDQAVQERQGRLHRHDARGHAEHRVPRGRSATCEFLDEAETANRYASELKRKHGVQAIVVAPARGRHPERAVQHDHVRQLHRCLGRDRRHRQEHDRWTSTCS